MKRAACNSKDIKILNRLMVRDLIRRRSPIARTEIAKETGLTPPTVTVIVNEMLKSGIVTEVGFEESSGGRRPVMLELNPNAAYIFAVRIQKGETVTALFDLVGNILNQQRQTLDTNLPEEVVNTVGDSFDWLLKSAGVNPRKVLWCGLASPGLINSRKGIIERSSNLGWEKIPIGPMLSERLGGAPVRVENNSNVAALAEKEYGYGRGYSDLIYLNLSVGLGLGIIINGKVFGGARGYAGEIGHMAFYPSRGPMCACGRNGCFEAICGISAVMEQIRLTVPDEDFSKFGLTKTKVSLNDLLASPLMDTPVVRRIFKETGNSIGIGVANLLSLFNTKMIILGGELSEVGDLLLDAVTTSARKRVLCEIFENVRIVKSNMREDPQLMGAYVLATEKVFNLEEWDL